MLNYPAAVSETRPEVLIKYLDQNPSNKKSILTAIHSHAERKEIAKNVKNTNIKSSGSEAIIKEHRKANRGNLLTSTIYTTIILAEITAIVLLFAWII